MNEPDRWMRALEAAVFGSPVGVRSAQSGKRPLLTTPQGGRVVGDRLMQQIWQHADGRLGEEILDYFQTRGLQRRQVAAALACLARAGLLSIEEETQIGTDAPLPVDQDSPLVSVVIVSYNSLAWLPDCLASLRLQTYRPLEMIVVDNASTDGSAEWLAVHQPEITLLRLERPCSLSGAINRGIEAARGEYILLLNPDVALDAQAVSFMVETAQSDASIAAVAGKLRLLWAPAFLNGIGNLVGALSWGMDNGLGYLDLGQFDHWTELPSACFAAALLPAKVLNEIGLLDEGFPMYYEDSEWCYRARLLGYSVRPAPRAVIYHAFSGRVPDGAGHSLSATKLQRVAYGRLRFISLLLGRGYLLRFLCAYLLEDVFHGVLDLIRGRWGHLRAYWRAWRSYLASLRPLRQKRKLLQARRKRTDREIFELQRHIPAPLVWRGLPLLTWDVVRHEYLPWIECDQPSRLKMTLGRALSIWRVEGIAALAHRIGRGVLWRWMQP
jgi:GT2 family glycosyltransferase